MAQATAYFFKGEKMIMKQGLFEQFAKAEQFARQQKVVVLPTAQLAKDLHAQGKVIVHKPEKVETPCK